MEHVILLLQFDIVYVNYIRTLSPYIYVKNILWLLCNTKYIKQLTPCFICVKQSDMIMDILQLIYDKFIVHFVYIKDMVFNKTTTLIRPS